MEAARRVLKLFLRAVAFVADGKYRRDTVRLVCGKKKDRKQRENILKYLETSKFPDTEGIRSFLKDHDGIVFPYDFSLVYSPDDVKVFRDTMNAGMMYVMHNGKRMYVKREFKFRFQVQNYYNSLRVEQDMSSPHRYLLEGRHPSEDCVVADLDGAEGMFALDIIDSVRKVYIFEGDPGWLEALRLTFAPYGDKVEIVSRYVAEKTEGIMVRLDDFFRDRKIDYIKADIEGWEEKMLEGASEILDTKVSQVLCCVYHREDSEACISGFLRKKGFSVSVNEKYMIFIYSDQVTGEPLRPPYLRHGVMYAQKARPDARTNPSRP